MISQVNGPNTAALAPGRTEAGASAAVENTAAVAAKVAAPKPDQVSLSTDSKLAHQVVQAAQASSGINGEVVQAIRSAIVNGRFPPPSSAQIARAVAEVAWLVGK